MKKTNIDEINKLILPIIREITPSIITHELCDVQPLSSPVGSAFTMRAKYETAPIDIKITKSCKIPVLIND